MLDNDEYQGLSWVLDKDNIDEIERRMAASLLQGRQPIEGKFIWSCNCGRSPCCGGTSYLCLPLDV